MRAKVGHIDMGISKVEEFDHGVIIMERPLKPLNHHELLV
jgi:hypothetical protein